MKIRILDLGNITLPKILLIITFLLITLSITKLFAQFNSIRIAYYHKGEELDSSFIIHAKKHNYNYILGEFNFEDVENPMERIGVDIKKAFQITSKYNMELIPKIQINSGWSSHWRHLRDKDNPKIEMNLIKAKNRKQKHLSWWGCPSFAPDSNGIDKSFEDLIKSIVKAHKSAKVPYPLEFIHLGHDEPAFYEFMHIGGVIPGKHGKNKHGSLYIPKKPREYSQKDRNWIRNSVGSNKYTDENISLAFQAIIVNSLYRKVKTIKNHSPNTKVMVYADAFDPCMGGINSFLTSFKRKDSSNEYCISQFVSDTLKGMATLPGLTNKEKKFFRKNVILLPWNYNGMQAFAGVKPVREDYDTYKTFSYFSKNGFKFIYTFELIPKDQKWLPEQNKINQMYEFVNMAKLFKENCLGYNAAHWSADWDNPKHRDCFRTMEELYKANQ